MHPVADVPSGRGWTPGRSRSAWLDIRLSEVVADKEQRFIERLGEGIDRTVAHVEPRRMPLTFAIALECIGRQARLGFVERRDDGVNLLEEALQCFQQRRMLAGAHDNLGFE